MRTSVRFPANLIHVHRQHWVKAHREGLPAMKADSLFRIALHAVAYDRALRNQDVQPIDVLPEFFPIVIKRPYAVVNCTGI
jgi:hypothetical protein